MLTYESMARDLGVTKQTIRNWALRIDPDGRHVDRSGDAHIIDAELASMIAHEVTKRQKAPTPQGETLAAVVEATGAERESTNAHFDELMKLKDEVHAAIVQAKDEQISDLKERIVELKGQLEMEQGLLAREREMHEETRRQLALSRALEGFHFPWQRRAIMARYALPEPSDGSEIPT